jgi:WD40 repeat protein
MITAGEDGRVSNWELHSGKLTDSRQVDEYGGLSSLVISPDGQYLAVAGRSKAVTIIGTIRGQQKTMFRHPEHVSGVTYDASGAALISLAQDGRFRKWHALEGKLISQWVYPLRFSEAHFSRNGRYCATYWPDRGISVYNIASKSEHYAIPTSKQNLQRLGKHPAWTFSDDETIFAYSDRNDCLYVIDLSRKSIINKIDCSSMVNRQISTIAISPCGQRIGVGSTCGLILVIDRASGKMIAKWQAHSNAINSLTFTGCGAMIISADSFPVGVLWDIAGMVD